MADVISLPYPMSGRSDYIRMEWNRTLAAVKTILLALTSRQARATFPPCGTQNTKIALLHDWVERLDQWLVPMRAIFIGNNAIARPMRYTSDAKMAFLQEVSSLGDDSRG